MYGGGRRRRDCIGCVYVVRAAVAGDMRQVILRITRSDASNSRYVGPRIHVAPSPSDTAAESSNEFALLDQLIIRARGGHRGRRRGGASAAIPPQEL